MKRPSRQTIELHPAGTLFEEASTCAFRGDGESALTLAAAGVKMLRRVLKIQRSQPAKEKRQRS